MLTKQSVTYEEIQLARKELLNGITIAIDPSIGSHSSMPGWAIYHGPILQEAGILQLNPDASIPVRLRELAYQLRKLMLASKPDVMVYEKVPVSAHGGGRSQVSHASLLYSVGTILSVGGPDKYVGIAPISWKKMVSPSYVKGDKEDAIEIGRIVIELANTIPEPGYRTSSRKGRSSTRK